MATGWLIDLGLVPTALAFCTWAYALVRIDAGPLGVTTYAIPPITIALGAALLDETPPLLAIAGGAICLLGVGLPDTGRRMITRYTTSSSGGLAAPSTSWRTTTCSVGCSAVGSANNTAATW